LFSGRSSAPSATVDDDRGATVSDFEELPLTPVDPIVLGRNPSLVKLGIWSLWRALRRPQGELPDGEEFPALTARRHGVRVSREHVAAYRAVCNAPGNDGVLPLAMPEVLFFGLLGTVGVDRRFPISPFGLIHVGQTLDGTKPLEVGRSYDLETRLAVARRTEKGYEIDTRLMVSDGDEVIWDAVTTVLSRVQSLRSRRRRNEPRTVAACEEGVELEIPADVGRAYARVSGDWNPHHLWPATARPLGYERPIAHGMWTLARLLGLVPADLDTTVGRAEVTFHRPVLLPGTITARVAPDGDAWTLDAWSPQRGTPHIRGHFHILEEVYP
jgi:hypothetical protein